MKYFKNIHSLSELKKQYRALALSNHPDRGGDTETMQTINAEFDALFEVMKRNPENVITETERKETATGYRRHFYTQNGWEGSRYDSRLTTKDISARVKVYTKERYPDYKFSVRCEYFSMGSALHIRLVSGPVAALAPDCGREYISTMSEIKDYPGITDEVRSVMADVVDYANSYNYDDSDSMEDYFDTNFYLHIYIGDYGKPYQVVAPKAKKVGRKSEKKESAAPDQPTRTEEQVGTSAALLMVDYSEKAIAVIGDTAQVKDDLKAMGGRFNRNLMVEGERVAGWVFSKSKTAEVLMFIGKQNAPEEAEKVEDHFVEVHEMAEEPAGVEAMAEIAAGVEALQGLSEEQIYKCLLSASDTLKQSPEFWKMINTAEDPTKAIGRTALACLLELGRKIKKGAA